MSCYSVMNELGENDSRFQDLLEVFNGDQQRALREYVKSYVLGKGDMKFQVISDSYQDSMDFLKGSFQVDDKFTASEADRIREFRENHYREKIIDKQKKLIFYNAKGKEEIIDPSELNAKIAEKIKQKEELSENFLSRLNNLFGLKTVRQDYNVSIAKEFPMLNPNVVHSLTEDLNRDNIKQYSEFAAKSWYIKSLKDENIMVHEKNVNGEPEYTILLPSLEREAKEFNRSGRRSFMANTFGGHKNAQSKGFSINDNLEGRKQVLGSILAMSIKASDPKIKIKGLRFASFAGTGSTFDMDLHEGIKNVRMLNEHIETSRMLPKELADVIKDSSRIREEDFEPSYVDLLYRNEKSKKEIEGAYVDYSLLRNIEEGNTFHALKDIENRLFYLIRNNGQVQENGLKAYEDPSGYIGKEILLLAKAKQQLIQVNGIDKRNFNTDKSLSLGGSWRRSITEYQRPEMNMFFNEFNSIALGYKQRFDKFLKKKDAVVSEYIKGYENHYGLSLKSRTLNYSEGYYDKLYEKISLKSFKNGKVSDQKSEVNIMKFMDPDDMSNSLLGFERKFIKDSVQLHRESIIRFINKKIETKEINPELFKSGEAWYNDKYRNQELLLPVMRKKSGSLLLEGSVKDSFTAMTEEANQFLEINPLDMLNERIYRTHGSASAQLGGVYGNESRLKSLGIEIVNGEFVVVNENVNKRSTGNVEQILQSSVFQNYKYEFEPQIVATHTAAKILLISEEMKKGVSLKHDIKTLDVLFENMLYGQRENVDMGNAPVGKIADTTRRVTGTLTLAINYKSAILATLGNAFSLISNAMSNRFGEQYFNGKDLAFAAKFATTDPKKFSDIVDTFVFHDKNETAMVHSSKYKVSDKGILNERHMMLMHSLGDRLTRGLVLISQLQHEKLLDNFVYSTDGQLVYDWTKDKRPDNIKAHIREKNERQEKNDLPYDDVQINTLTSITAKMFGAYTDEDRTRMQTNALAQFAGQFKGYLIARSNELYQSGFDNTNITWYSQDENGNLQLKPFFQEGMANTLFHFMNEIKRLENSPVSAWKNLKPEQRQNMKKVTADVIMFGAIFIMYGFLFGDWDEEEGDQNEAGKKLRAGSSFMYMKFAWLDIVGVYNASDYLESFTPAAIPTLKKYANALWAFATGDFEEGLTKGIRATGAGKTGADIVGAVQAISE